MEWSQETLAKRCHCSQAMISQIVLGSKRPGLASAHAIERVTVEKNAAGRRWPKGPIRTEEWLGDPDPRDTSPGHADPSGGR